MPHQEIQLLQVQHSHIATSVTHLNFSQEDTQLGLSQLNNIRRYSHTGNYM
jgi:hypothetical protein